PQPPWVRACLYWAHSVSPHQTAGDTPQAADTEPLLLNVMEPLIWSCSINDFILPTCWMQRTVQNQPASAHWGEGEETHRSNRSIARCHPNHLTPAGPWPHGSALRWHHGRALPKGGDVGSLIFKVRHLLAGNLLDQLTRHIFQGTGKTT
ncbi:hypothetical protein MC885_008535, partial [Smutsia gigantea]